VVKKFGLPTQKLIAVPGENVSYYLSALTLASFVLGASGVSAGGFVSEPCGG